MQNDFVFLSHFSYAEASKMASNVFVKKLQVLLVEKEVVNVWVCGGRSVELFYKYLQPQLIEILSTGRIHFFLTDEKYPEEGQNIEKNTSIISSCLFWNINNDCFIGSTGVDLIKDIEKFNNYFENNAIKNIDIIILGIWEDGHMAGIFCWDDENDVWLCWYKKVAFSQKQPKDRITLSASMISSSGTVFLFFQGEDKKKALENFLDSKKWINNCPAVLLKSSKDLYIVNDILF